MLLIRIESSEIEELQQVHLVSLGPANRGFDDLASGLPLVDSSIPVRPARVLHALTGAFWPEADVNPGLEKMKLRNTRKARK